MSQPFFKHEYAFKLLIQFSPGGYVLIYMATNKRIIFCCLKEFDTYTLYSLDIPLERGH